MTTPLVIANEVKQSRATLLRGLPDRDRLDLGGAELEFGDFADRVELRVGQDVGSGLGIAERDEHLTRRASVLDEIEPEAVASLAPAELRRLGIAAGESVRVTTRRGMIELKARADSNVAPGQVFIPFCYAEAAANILTNPQLDPIGKIPEFKFCAAKVEPAAAVSEAAE